MESVQSQRSALVTTRTEGFPGEEALAKLHQALEIEVSDVRGAILLLSDCPAFQSIARIQYVIMTIDRSILGALSRRKLRRRKMR